jgi:hypothetical protein
MLSTVLPTLQNRQEHSTDTISLFSDIADPNLRILHQKLTPLLPHHTTLLQHRPPPSLIRNIHPRIPHRPIAIHMWHMTREFLATALDTGLSLHFGPELLEVHVFDGKFVALGGWDDVDGAELCVLLGAWNMDGKGSGGEGGGVDEMCSAARGMEEWARGVA